MFVFSEKQLKLLLSSLPSLLPGPLTPPPLPPPHQPPPTTPRKVLDIGSGDGHVTDKVKSVMGASAVNVTETCRVMQRILRQRGYKSVKIRSISWPPFFKKVIAKPKQCLENHLLCLRVYNTF